MTAHPRVVDVPKLSRTRAYNVSLPFAVQPSVPTRGYILTLVILNVLTFGEEPDHVHVKYLVATVEQEESKNIPVFAVVVNVSRLLEVPFVKYIAVPSGSVAILLVLTATEPETPRFIELIVALCVLCG